MEHRLKDGRHVIVRPIQQHDQVGLQIGLSLLSPRSIYYRFHTYRGSFTPTELQYLVNCDGVKHIAWVAYESDGQGNELCGIGVARCIRDEIDPEVGEVAFVVLDDWQGVGVGKRLLRQLAEQSISIGIRKWRASVLAENHRALGLLRKFGTQVSQSADGAEVELTVEISTVRYSSLA